MANESDKVIVEKSSGGPLVAILAILVIALIAVGAYSLIQNQNHKDASISTAAEKVGDAAQDAGEAAKTAANKQ
ncbi:MAG: hypothetical protein J7494_05265 [Sphingobium sp.]|nr:hypothetical protein [Sphingobium sp.]